MEYGDTVEPVPFTPAFVTLLADARAGNAEAIGVLLQSFQPYLLSIAKHELPDRLRSKCDGSDLVQETLLEAHRGFAGFDGTDSDDLRVWLCGILTHNVKDLIRRYRDTSKRSTDRERSLDAGTPSAEVSGRAVAVDPYPTPCTRVIASENISALREALLRLPEDEQVVIALRHFECLSFQEVGRRLDRTPEAARKLCARAMSRLQHLLEISRGTARPEGGRATTNHTSSHE
jgi:RNA polymerase sigma-70 factor, ECF subfamily